MFVLRRPRAQYHPARVFQRKYSDHYVKIIRPAIFTELTEAIKQMFGNQLQLEEMNGQFGIKTVNTSRQELSRVSRNIFKRRGG